MKILSFHVKRNSPIAHFSISPERAIPAFQDSNISIAERSGASLGQVLKISFLDLDQENSLRICFIDSDNPSGEELHFCFWKYGETSLKCQVIPFPPPVAYCQAHLGSAGHEISVRRLLCFEFFLIACQIWDMIKITSRPVSQGMEGIYLGVGESSILMQRESSLGVPWSRTIAEADCLLFFNLSDR